MCMETGGTTTPETLMKTMLAAMDDVLAVPLSTMPVDDLGDWVCVVESAVNAKAAALSARSVQAADDALVGPRNGCRTTAQYVAARTPVDPAVVRRHGLLGQFLNSMPVLQTAFEAGRLSVEHVDVLRKIDKPAVHFLLVESQQMLLDAAVTCDWKDFDQVVGYWVNAADPDGTLPKDQLRLNKFRMRKQADGSFTGDFKLDPVTGQAVNGAVSREYQRLYKADIENDVDRTVPARWAAAFANVMIRGADPTGAKSPAPLVHIVLGEQLAEELTTKLIEDDPTPVETSASDPNRRCEFLDGTPLHPDHAAAILAVGKLRRLVLDPDNAIVNFGDRTRMFPPQLKQALLVAARGRCQITGCDAPFPWLQADHIIPANKHGPTNLTNGLSSVEFRRSRNSQGTRRVPIHTTNTKKTSSGSGRPRE